MKHRDLIRALRQIARDHGLELIEDGGGDHEKWRAGPIPIAVPRHRDINELTAKTIIQRLERQLAAKEDE